MGSWLPVVAAPSLPRPHLSGGDPASPPKRLFFGKRGKTIEVVLSRDEKASYRNHNSNNKSYPTLSFIWEGLFFLFVTLVVSFIWYWNMNRTMESLWFTPSFWDRGHKVFPRCPWELENSSFLAGGWCWNSGKCSFSKPLVTPCSSPPLCRLSHRRVPGISQCLLTWLTRWCLVGLDSYKHSPEIIGKGWGWDTLCTGLIRTQEKPLEGTGVSDLW